MKRNDFAARVFIPVVSILVSFLIGAVIIAIMGANPLEALQYLWKGAFGNVRNLGTTFARATPLIFTTLCACFAYRCGVFNLGGEGQFIIGAILACFIATKVPVTGVPGRRSTRQTKRQARSKSMISRSRRTCSGRMPASSAAR